MKVKENPQSLYYKNMLLFSLSLIIIALVVRMLFNIPMTFYPATQTYVLMALGVTIFSFALFFREYDMTNNKEKIFSFIGKNSFSFYILHVVIGIVPFMVLDLFNFFTFMGVMIYTIFVTGIIALICYYSGKKYGLGPIELLVKKLP